MPKEYSHERRNKRLKKGLLTFSFIVGLTGVGVVIFFIYNDLQLNQSEEVVGEERTVSQVLGDSDAYLVSHDKFEFELPGDWREIDKVDRQNEQSITWQATLRDEDNRWLKLYINTIPEDEAIVRLLPVNVEGSEMRRGQMSGHCNTFTGSSTEGQRYPLAKWEDVEFLCDANRTVNTNIIGTGQEGQPINTVEITGEDSGTNQYFFVYRDQNIRPNFEIFYNAVNSFRAK